MDGVVTREGGRELRDALDAVVGGCPVGHAVSTKAIGRLNSVYGWQQVVHCCPPLFDKKDVNIETEDLCAKHESWRNTMIHTWRSAMHAALEAAPKVCGISCNNSL